MKIVSGTYIAGANAANIECGFIPDYVELWTAVNGTELVYHWSKVFGDTSALTGQYGILDTAGVKSVPTTAATGIIAYDATALSVMLPNPAGGADLRADLPSAYTVALSTAATARTATALGSIVKPSLGNENGLLAECTTAGTGSAEPTWPTIAGETVVDNSVTWTMREWKTEARGVKGFTVGATVCSDGEIHVFRAEQHDRAEDMGDNGLIDPSRFDNT
ncbi:hypothetical protein LCGC14_2149710 [marine sediment metagenome]|uniref:Uncharacterized protein n=1 Tax=marine sediment metagenome TaxID=412755 RepID=A0A0F9G8W6_9ZZZZ